MRRVVLEAAVAWRVVGRRDDDPVRLSLMGPPRGVGPQDRVGHRRRRRVAVGRVDHDRHVVAGQNLQRRRPGRLAERMGVPSDEQGPVDALLAAVLTDRLGGGQDVRLVEGGRQRRPTVPAGAERHLLLDLVGVGHTGVVRGDQVGDVDEVLGPGGLSCAFVRHGSIMPDPAAQRGPPRGPAEGTRPAAVPLSRPCAAAVRSCRRQTACERRRGRRRRRRRGRVRGPSRTTATA